ncbi:MAG: recombinase family protein [Geobacter sp.]|nr:MAG: recombinase family protein [Geobacter sp.]
MPKAYSYMRFSTPEQAKGDSTRRQLQLAEEYAAANGLDLDDTLKYRDDGVSAYRGANIAIGKLGVFMEAIRRGEVEHGSFLLVESLDRISRDAVLAAQTIFNQIILAGVTIVTLADKAVYSQESVNKDPFKLIQAIMILIRANEESDIKSKRLKAAWQQKRQKLGERPLTSKAPAWLQFDAASRQFNVIPERGEIVRRIFADHLAGKGCPIIAKELREEGIATWGQGGRSASIWRDTYIRKILNNPAVIGTLVPHIMDHSVGRKRIPLEEVKAYYPQVITQEEFARVQELRLGNNMRGRKTSNRLQNVFSLVAACPLCGAKLIHQNKSPWRYLVCDNARHGQGCRYKAIPYLRLEEVFLDEFEKALWAFPPTNPALSRIHGELSVVRKNIKKAEQEQARLLEYIKSGSEIEGFKTTRAMNEELSQLERHIDEYKQQLSRLVVRHKMLKPQQMDNLIKEFKAEVNYKEVRKERVNSLLRSMCKKILISAGKIDVIFKVGPRLIIEYGKDWSRSEWVKDHKADSEGELEVVQAN